MASNENLKYETIKRLYVHLWRLRGAHKPRKINHLKAIAEEDFEGEDDDFAGMWLAGRKDEQLFIKIKQTLIYNSLDHGDFKNSENILNSMQVVLNV